MIPLTLEQVAAVVGGDTVGGSAGAPVGSVVIDSRAVEPGALFVALPGDHVDGHDFVAHAMSAGAVGALVASSHGEQLDPSLPLVVVDDPADALLGLGAWVRDTVDPTVVGITGSNGKTTTKDLLAAACRDLPTVANTGSYNNELGVPLTCCRLRHHDEVLVCELGMRGKGHIAELAALVRPAVAIVTSVAAVHLELLGTIEAIADAKAELVEALPHDGVAILAFDDPRVRAMADRTDARVVRFGRAADADWRAVDITLDADARARFTADTPHGAVEVYLPVPGLHNVGNALAALAAAAEVGVALPAAVAGLEQANVSPWRLQWQTMAGVRVLNDVYNANPTSVLAALRTLSALPGAGRRFAVLGTMAEIGATSADAHRDVGRVAAALDLDGLVTIGDDAADIGVAADQAAPSAAGLRVAVGDVDAAAEWLAATVRPGDVVLVKASRSAGLERVVSRLADLLAAPVRQVEHS